MSDGLTLRGPSLRRNELLRPGLGEPVEVGEQQGLDQLVWWIVGGGGGGGGGWRVVPVQKGVIPYLIEPP